MDKDRISEEVGKLPEIPADKYPIADDEIWEADEHGGHFKLTRNYIEVGKIKLSFLTLSVSGILGSSRERIIDDFTDAFGKPDQLFYDDSNGVHFVSWLVSSSPTT